MTVSPDRPPVRCTLLHDVVLHQSGGTVLPGIFHLPDRPDQVRQFFGDIGPERTWFPGQGFDQRPFPDQMQPLLRPMGHHELLVHTLVEDTAGHGCDGVVRHQRLLRLPIVMGHPSRAIRGRKGQ